MDALREQLMRELASVEERPAVEKRLARAMAERRGALSNLDRIERELGPRLFEIEAYKQRRARMQPRLFTFLAPPVFRPGRARGPSPYARNAFLPRISVRLDTTRDSSLPGMLTITPSDPRPMYCRAPTSPKP